MEVAVLIWISANLNTKKSKQRQLLQVARMVQQLGKYNLLLTNNDGDLYYHDM